MRKDMDKVIVERPRIGHSDGKPASRHARRNARQQLHIGDVKAGVYLLRQQIVRDGSPVDATRFDDARITEIKLDGKGGFLHMASRYDGD